MQGLKRLGELLLALAAAWVVFAYGWQGSVAFVLAALVCITVNGLHERTKLLAQEVEELRKAVANSNAWAERKNDDLQMRIEELEERNRRLSSPK